MQSLPASMTAFRSTLAIDRTWASSVEARAVVGLLAKHLDIDRCHIAPGTKLSAALGAADVHLVELVLALEASFDIDISEEEVATFETVDDVVAAVVRARKTRKARARGG